MINHVNCRKKLNVRRYLFVSNKSIIGKNKWPFFVSWYPPTICLILDDFPCKKYNNLVLINLFNIFHESEKIFI